ncbi:MAG: hypothetical protein ABWZ25_03910 [Chitinophagaceae bacterium]
MSRKLINRAILLCFLALVSYAITWSIQSRSTSGLILSILSLAAGIHFCYLLGQLKKQTDSDPDM